MGLRLTLEHFNKLIGPEIKKTDAIHAVQKRKEEFIAKLEERFGPASE